MIQTIADVVTIFFEVLKYAILIRCIMSWFPIGKGNPVYELLHTFTEPILAPVRIMVQRSPIGPSMSMIDFSPIIAMLLLAGIEQLILQALVSFA